MKSPRRKVLPYDSVIAIGDDAITITNSENILKLDEATAYEPLLNENVRVIATKAITKAGIQGLVGKSLSTKAAKIAKCAISSEGSQELKEISAEQISIFGKQVAVIDNKIPEKNKNVTVMKRPTAKSEEKSPEPAKAEHTLNRK